MSLYMGKNCQCRGPHCHEIECNAIYCAKHEYLLVLCKGILLFVLVQRRIQRSVTIDWTISKTRGSSVPSLSTKVNTMSVSSQKHQKFKVSGDASEQILGGIFTLLGNLNAKLRACGFVSLNLSLLLFRYFTKHSITFHFKCKLLQPRKIKIDLFALTCIVILSSNNTMQNRCRVF